MAREKGQESRSQAWPTPGPAGPRVTPALLTSPSHELGSAEIPLNFPASFTLR